jgi:hypothetical protein
MYEQHQMPEKEHRLLLVVVKVHVCWVHLNLRPIKPILGLPLSIYCRPDQGRPFIRG